jgi:hypothetical protein
MNEIVNINTFQEEETRERLDTNVIKLSVIKPVEKGRTIYAKPASRIILSDDDRLAHVDAAYEYLMKKSMKPKNIVLGAILVAAGFVSGIIGSHLLTLYFGKIIW